MATSTIKKPAESVVITTFTTTNLSHLASASATLYRMGNIGILRIGAKNSNATLNVGNDATFNISNSPTMPTYFQGIGYSGSTACICAVSPTGAVNIRATGIAWQPNYDLSATIPVVFS